MANEIDLNELENKTDSLPNDWKVMLIDPTTGLPARNMTVARFIELFTPKQPEVTESSNGLMSSKSLKSNPSSILVNRKIFSPNISSKKSFKIRIKDVRMNINIKILGGWAYLNGFGVLEKVISYYGDNIISGTKVYKCSANTCSSCYISDPYKEGDYICVDVVNKYSQGADIFAVIVESYYTFDNFEFMDNQTPRTADLTKNNRDETEFAFKTSVNTYAAFSNALTEPILLNNSILPPPPQIACQTTQNQQIQSSNLRNPLYRIRTTRMVQFQLNLNQTKYRNNTSGRLIRSAVLSWNYKKKIRDLNKSSISLTITRYNKCNLPRAGPPRLIN